jgi:glycosyltransferase involved in cell wall biosynthesis
MRILFATNHSYLPERAGGVEANTHEWCMLLSRMGHEVAVLCALDPRGRYRFRTFLQRRLSRGGGAFPEHSLGYPVYRTWEVAKHLHSVVAHFRPGLVVVQPADSASLALQAKGCGMPVILYLHDAELEALGGLEPATIADRWLANSRFVAERARRKLEVVPQVIPPLVRAEAYAVQGLRRRVLFVNPDPRKGVEIALALAEGRPDIPFDFVECWPSNRDRIDYRRRAKAAGNVAWHARTPDMRRHYRNARLLLVPSVWEEGWGRVVTEAQVSGIPALARARGGFPESVGPGGLLIPPDAGIAAWRVALDGLWNDEPLYRRLAAAALDHARRPEIQPEFLAEKFLAVAGAIHR